MFNVNIGNSYKIFKVFNVHILYFHLKCLKQVPVVKELSFWFQIKKKNYYKVPNIYLRLQFTIEQKPCWNILMNNVLMYKISNTHYLSCQLHQCRPLKNKVLIKTARRMTINSELNYRSVSDGVIDLAIMRLGIFIPGTEFLSLFIGT